MTIRDHAGRTFDNLNSNGPNATGLSTYHGYGQNMASALSMIFVIYILSLFKGKSSNEGKVDETQLAKLLGVNIGFVISFVIEARAAIY